MKSGAASRNSSGLHFKDEHISALGEKKYPFHRNSIESAGKYHMQLKVV